MQAGDETVLMNEDDLASGADRSLERLAENYQSLLHMGEIYYPLAYRFVRRLGSGQQGVVFQALRQGARGCVTQHAIKLHDPSIYPSTEKYWTDMGRIASQISKLQMVSSPQLVSRDIYEEVNGVGYTQMEVVEGVDVAYLVCGDHLEKVRPNCSEDEWAYFTDVLFNIKQASVGIQPGVAVYLMRQTLRGLEALHDAGFLHSDIKPANMMVDRLGIVKLIDYGRAVMVDERSTFLLGTPQYMAPELHRGAAASIQSDLYSVGLVGLELLRGRPLVDADEDEGAIVRQKMNLPNVLPELLPEAVRGNQVLVEVFQKLLHPDPAGRFGSAMEADSGVDGLIQIHKQLALLGIDTEYDRELKRYVNKVLGERSSPAVDVEAFLG